MSLKAEFQNVQFKIAELFEKKTSGSVLCFNWFPLMIVGSLENKILKKP